MVVAGGWDELDEAWRLAFEMAWEAVVTGNIGVGAVVTDAAGNVVASARNRVMDATAPAGQVAGSSLAHAEINALTGLPFRSPRELVLTTTLRPCLQCAAAIRMAPIAHVRFAGDDPLWHGADEFGALNTWLARRPTVPSTGPMPAELGLFATLLARLGRGLEPHVEDNLRRRGESALLDVVRRLEHGGFVARSAARPVDEVYAALHPELTAIVATG